ncbi:hypothetical protein Pmani_001833, partial [Petrolisthes manimaculis]
CQSWSTGKGRVLEENVRVEEAKVDHHSSNPTHTTSNQCVIWTIRFSFTSLFSSGELRRW